MSRAYGILLALLVATAAFADSADLRIHAQSYDQDLDAIFAVVNGGPDIARDVVVTMDVPAGVNIVRASFDAKPCDTSRRPVRCELGGDIFTGNVFPRYGGLEITAPLADATYPVTITVTSPTPDPKPENNSVSFTWTTRIEADLNAMVFKQTDRTDPGGTGSFLANICNEVRDNVPANVRAELSASNGTIESLTPATGYTCTVDGATAVCTRQGQAQGCALEPFKITVRASNDRRGGETRLTVRATAHIPDRDASDDSGSDAFAVYRWIIVDRTADAGAGSLRDAIEQANAGCSPGPCRIVFEIPGPVPAEGWFTITPATPLPAITADRVTLEGTQQTAFTGDTNPNGPEIAIDGRLARSGLKMLSRCEGVVRGLAIGNFDEDQGLWLASNGALAVCGSRPDRREVSDNHIGVDPSGTVAWPNLRGLRADNALLTITRNVISHNRHSGIWMWRGSAVISKNRLERNGASGMLIGPEVTYGQIEDNAINHHPQMGIALVRSAQPILMRRNSMKNNGGLGIDWGLDGVSPVSPNDHDGPPNAPVILSARYAGNNGIEVTVAVNSAAVGKYFNSGVIDLFANDSPDADGERHIWSYTMNQPAQTVTFTMFGDHRGKWINATWTRRHEYFSRPGDPRTHSHEGNFYQATSELSNAVLVE